MLNKNKKLKVILIVAKTALQTYLEPKESKLSKPELVVVFLAAGAGAVAKADLFGGGARKPAFVGGGNKPFAGLALNDELVLLEEEDPNPPSSSSTTFFLTFCYIIQYQT
jgi:hypothetical protein